MTTRWPAAAKSGQHDEVNRFRGCVLRQDCWSNTLTVQFSVSYSHCNTQTAVEGTVLMPVVLWDLDSAGHFTSTILSTG